MSKRIRIRRGKSKDFREDQMLSGELAIDTDTGDVHACYQDRKCRTLADTEAVNAAQTTADSAATAAAQNTSDIAALNQTTHTTVSTDYGTITFYKFGKVVMCCIPAIDTQTLAAWKNITLGAIPDGYRPAGNQMPCYNIMRQEQTSVLPVLLRPAPTGLIILQNQSNNSVTTGAMMPVNLTWITG